MVHHLETLHGTRAVKSAKTFFVSSPKLDAVPAAAAGIRQGLRELAGTGSTCQSCDSDRSRESRSRSSLSSKEAFEGDTVSFIPRGAELKEAL